MGNAILERARTLAKRYRDSVSDLVAIIAEVERLRLFAEAGFPSLFEYCVKDLLLSEDDAYKMIQAARASGRRPEILSYLADGSLSARAVALLAPESKGPDFGALLDQEKGQTVRQVERMVAARQEPAPKRDVVRPTGTSPASPEKPATLMFRIAFDADDELKALLDRARGLLLHRFPDGKLEAIFKEALAHLIGSIDPLEREAALPRPGARTNAHARRVPPSVRDAVWKRDQGRCAFVSSDGRRCEATSWLEVDHKIPWALGGRSDDPDNLRLLCRAHNPWTARQTFGERADRRGGA